MASVLCQAWSFGLGTRRSDCTPLMEETQWEACAVRHL